MSNQEEKKRLEELEAQFSSLLAEVMEEPDEIYGERIGKVDYSFLDEEKAKKSGSKKYFRHLLRAAVFVLCVLVAGSAMAIWINSEPAVATKFSIQKMFYEIRDGVFGTNANEVNESETSNLIEVEYTKWEDIEKAKKLVPDLLVPTYIPEGYEFEKLIVETEVTGEVIVDYVFIKNKDKYHVSIFNLENIEEAKITHKSTVNFSEVGEVMVWKDKINNCSENNGATIMFENKCILVTGDIQENDIIKIFEGIL